MIDWLDHMDQTCSWFLLIIHNPVLGNVACPSKTTRLISAMGETMDLYQIFLAISPPFTVPLKKYPVVRPVNMPYRLGRMANDLIKASSVASEPKIFWQFKVEKSWEQVWRGEESREKVRRANQRWQELRSIRKRWQEARRDGERV